LRDSGGNDDQHRGKLVDNDEDNIGSIIRGGGDLFQVVNEDVGAPATHKEQVEATEDRPRQEGFTSSFELGNKKVHNIPDGKDQSNDATHQEECCKTIKVTQA
jgi:hypothetical protein